MNTFHGSDLEKIEQVYGIRKEEITGFGANVNPLGLSPFPEGISGRASGCIMRLS